MTRLKLFCIPFAGGSAAFCLKWKRFLDSRIDLVPLELAGRGIRFGEPCSVSFSNTLEDLYSQLQSYVKSEEPYALLGHSMGAGLAYELARLVNDRQFQPPVHLFVSGRRPPHQPEQRKFEEISSLPNQELIQFLYELGGTADEFLKDPEIQETFLPIIRSDYLLLASYLYSPCVNKLSIPISVWLGNRDTFSVSEAQEWEQLTLSHCQVTVLEGGHFFIHDHAPWIAEQLNQLLT